MLPRANVRTLKDYGRTRILREGTPGLNGVCGYNDPMPPIEPGVAPQEETPKKLTVTERLKRSEAERERLEREVDSLSEAALSKWLLIAHRESSHVAMTQTFSWRVTKPLRQVRLVQRKVTEVGVVRTAQVVMGALQRRRKSTAK